MIRKQKMKQDSMLLVDCLLRMKKRKRAAIYTCHCHTLSLMVEFCLLGPGAALQLPNILV